MGPPCASTRHHPHRLGSWEAQLGCYGDGMRGQQVSAEPAEMGRAGVAKCGTPHPLSWSPLQHCQEPGTSACRRHCQGSTAGKQGPGWVSPLCRLETCAPHCGSAAGTSSLGLSVPLCDAVLGRSGGPAHSAAVLVYPSPGACLCPRNEAHTVHTRGTRTHTRLWTAHTGHSLPFCPGSLTLMRLHRGRPGPGRRSPRRL